MDNATVSTTGYDPLVNVPGAGPAIPRPRRPEEPAPAPVPAGARRRLVRSWMFTAPVDLLAMLTPLLLTTRYWRGTLAAALLTVVILAAGGLYRTRRHLSILDELPSLCGRILVAAAIVAIIAAMRHDSVGYGTGFMRGVAFAGAVTIVGRAVTRKAILVARIRRWVAPRALIVGTGPIAVELARLLRRYPQYGLRFAGYVDVAPRPGGVPLAGTLDRLAETAALVGAEVLVVADPDCSEATLMELVRLPGPARWDLWLVPRLWGSRTHSGLADHIGAIPVVQVAHTTLSGPRWAIKRASDLVFASVALVVLSPILLLCALATYLDSGPGIFFYQERVGRHGKPFRVIKFRTMRPSDEQEAQTTWSIADDARVSTVGRFLRRTSLDELPQLWNILRGDMTMVGPRPERPYFVAKFSALYPEYAMRHRVPVGLTGLAQVSGLRGDTPIADRARFDNYYIENWSLWLDVKVILRTAGEILRGGGR
jgi:exopolysaccharide biosynthesis polyprenyl glycosylphosphotransferase